MTNGVLGQKKKNLKIGTLAKMETGHMSFWDH